jgi:hypothetical protein
MSKPNENKETSQEEVSKKEVVKQKKKGQCKDCRWYDHESERTYHAFPAGKVHVDQLRAKCMNKSLPTYGHLVQNLSGKSCFEKGSYKPLRSEKVAKEKAE